MIHIANIFANEMANHLRINVTDQIGRENKAAIQGHNYIQPPPSKFARDFFAPTQRRGPRCAQRNKLPLSARSKMFLGNHDPRPGLFIRCKIGGHRKAAGPNENFATS